MKKFEGNLIPHDSHKSYYGKAKYMSIDGITYLKSYDTIVCSVEEDGTFHRHWYGWSATTARHINSFRIMCGLSPICKAEWCKMEAEAL